MVYLSITSDTDTQGSAFLLPNRACLIDFSFCATNSGVFCIAQEGSNWCSNIQDTATFPDFKYHVLHKNWTTTEYSLSRKDFPKSCQFECFYYDGWKICKRPY